MLHIFDSFQPKDNQTDDLDASRWLDLLSETSEIEREVIVGHEENELFQIAMDQVVDSIEAWDTYSEAKEGIETIMKKGQYHEPEIDTGFNKSLDANIRGFRKTIDIFEKYFQLAKKETELVKEETRISLKALEKLKKQSPSMTITYNGLSLEELDRLAQDVSKANDILIKFPSVIDIAGSVDVVVPASLTKSLANNPSPSRQDVAGMVLKKNPKFESWIKTNQEIFPFVGLGRFTMTQDKFVIYTGITPYYKKHLKDKEHQIDTDADYSALVNLFKVKLKMLKYLEFVISSRKDIDKIVSSVEKKRKDWEKLYQDDKKMFYLAMFGLSLLRNYARLYGAIVYKVTKGTKYTNRKIRLIQTRIKNMV